MTSWRRTHLTDNQSLTRDYLTFYTSIGVGLDLSTR